MDIDISQLRQNLPDYLARVRQGERIRVMSRGRVVAEMAPPAGGGDHEAAGARRRSRGGAVRRDDPTGPLLAADDA